ncbi:MAG TPA: hypothetical protein VNJ54_04360, partial [Plantibacter sp.]|uniref:hypothetical protein n=1 Tax=Plantibacter sp. TaxID=1871045 RepID=UPI002BC4C946|nr:hypothetical protein [Plantibacter sp.]
MAFADAYTYVDPSIILVANPAGTPAVAADIQLKCTSNEVHLTPEDSMAEVDSFCNPDGEIPSSTKWMSNFNILLSFTNGADVGSWNTLHPLRKTKQTFKLKPKDSALGVGNPEVTFQAYVPSVPFLDGSRGESSRFEFELSVIGEPVFATA